MTVHDVSGVSAALPRAPDATREVARAAGARATGEPGAPGGEGAVRIQRTRLTFAIEDDHQVVIRLVDGETNEVVRQIPPEELRQPAARLDRPTGGLIERVA
jgi:hypothetical protein